MVTAYLQNSMEKNMSKTENNKPVQHIRLGNVAAAIWKQKDGFYTATLVRSYKDRDGSWQSTSSFPADDLIVAAKVADLAAEAILALQSDV